MPADAPQLEFWSHIQNQRADSFLGSHPRLEWLVRHAERFAGQRRLLNIGCGDGYLELAAQRRRWKVLSVDPDEESVNRLRSQSVDARRGMIEALPVEDDSVDVVVCTEVFEHLPTEVIESGLQEIRRVLAPGGTLFGTVPFREDLAFSFVFCPHCKQTFHRWGHLHSFDEASLRSMLGRYFPVVTVWPRYFPNWPIADWKGKLAISARVVFGMAGIHGANSNLLFIGRNSS
jgi:SAM-dependent methyltransferase